MDMKEHFKARMNNQLNEVSIGISMKRAIRKGKSPLVAAAKALAHNIKIRGVRGAFSPIDNLERRAWQLQTTRDSGTPGAYKSPDLLVRAYDMAKNIADRISVSRAANNLLAPISRATRKIVDPSTNLVVHADAAADTQYLGDRPIGDELEQGYIKTGGVSGVRDAQAMRKDLLDLSARLRADPRRAWWRGGPPLRDRYPFTLFTRGRKAKPYERKTTVIADIPAEETTELDIARGKLPGGGRKIPKK